MNGISTLVFDTQTRRPAGGDVAEYEEATTTPRMLRTKDSRIERHRSTVVRTDRGGRREGAKKYSDDEIDMMLTIVGGVEPLGTNMWAGFGVVVTIWHQLTTTLHESLRH